MSSNGVSEGVVPYVTVVITILSTESGMRRLGLVLECLTKLSESTVGAILGTCGGRGRVEVWRFLLTEVRCIAGDRRLRWRGVRRGLYLGLRVEMGG